MRYSNAAPHAAKHKGQQLFSQTSFHSPNLYAQSNLHKKFVHDQTQSLSTLPTSKYVEICSPKSNTTQPLVANSGFEKPIKSKTQGSIVAPLAEGSFDKRDKEASNPRRVEWRYIEQNNSKRHTQHPLLRLQRLEQENRRIQQLEQQNYRLRSKLLDCELKQRDQAESINKLQMRCQKLQNIIQKYQSRLKGVSSTTLDRKQLGLEKQYLNIVKSTFADCFGLTSYHKIWKKQKKILKEWMDYKNQELQLVERVMEEKHSRDFQNPQISNQQKQLGLKFRINSEPSKHRRKMKQGSEPRYFSPEQY